MQLILFKDNANRVKSKMKANEMSFYFLFRSVARLLLKKAKTLDL